MTKDDQIDVWRGCRSCRRQSGSAMMSMHDQNRPFTNFDANPIRQRVDQIERIGVSTHCRNFCDFLQFAQDRGASRVARVNDQVDPSAPKEPINTLHRRRRAGGQGMGITEHAKPGRREGFEIALHEGNLASPLASTHELSVATSSGSAFLLGITVLS